MNSIENSNTIEQVFSNCALWKTGTNNRSHICACKSGRNDNGMITTAIEQAPEECRK